MEGILAFILSMQKESQNKYLFIKSPKNVRNLIVLSRNLHYLHKNASNLEKAWVKLPGPQVLQLSSLLSYNSLMLLGYKIFDFKVKE